MTKIPWRRVHNENHAKKKMACFRRFRSKEPRHSENISDKNRYLHRSTRLRIIHTHIPTYQRTNQRHSSSIVRFQWPFTFTAVFLQDSGPHFLYTEVLLLLYIYTIGHAFLPRTIFALLSSHLLHPPYKCRCKSDS